MVWNGQKRKNVLERANKKAERTRLDRRALGFTIASGAGEGRFTPNRAAVKTKKM